LRKMARKCVHGVSGTRNVFSMPGGRSWDQCLFMKRGPVLWFCQIWLKIPRIYENRDQF
jgi:hypothetical protein